MDVKQYLKMKMVGSSELRRCVKVEVVARDSPSLMVLMVSVDVKQHLKKSSLWT